MILALILSLILWTYPPPVILVCPRAHASTTTPSNCERVHYMTLGKFPIP